MNFYHLEAREVELYEHGELPFERIVLMFQGLADSGTIWKMNNDYVLELHKLIDRGYVVAR